MKHRLNLFFLKMVTIATLLVSLGGLVSSQRAYADVCDGQGAFSICAVTSGTVSVETPILSCSLVSPTNGGYIDIMQGCNGSNWEKIGFSNYTGLQEWVLRYGWTYRGTGDGYRYFAFSNYTYFQPDDTSAWWITYSDGNEYNNNCYGGGHTCDYNAWQNYITDWHSPTAQLRDWVTTGRPGNQTMPALEYPQPGLTNCKGSELGTTSSVQFNAGYTTNGGNVGIQGTSTYQYSQDGQCNAGAGDAYSTYMNLNWGGVTCAGGVICAANATQSPLSFLDVTATNGPTGANGNAFWQGWNLTVNWWSNQSASVFNMDIHRVEVQGPNIAFSQDKWSY